MKSLTFISTILFFYFIQSSSLAQLDSVWYEGPSIGSVSSGVLQSTDNFSDSYIRGQGELVESKINKINSEEQIESFFNWDKSQLPDYYYVEDSNVSNKSTENGGQTILLDNFSGMLMENYVPPDPTLAVGPNHIIGCVNRLFKIWDKEGNLLKTISAYDWFLPVSPHTGHDPQVIYDHYEGRWFYLHGEYNLSTFVSGVVIGYSDDDDPLGEWYIYRLDTKMHGTVPSNTWGDYPKVGFDEEAIYIMMRCFLFGGGHLYDKIRIISKDELYASNGDPFTYTDIWNIRTPGMGASGYPLDCIHPAITYTPAGGQYFLWAAGMLGPIVLADYYVIYKITDPLTTPILRGKVLPAQFYSSPPYASQLGGVNFIESLGFITRAPIVRDNFLYVSHGIQNTNYPSFSSIKYIKVDLSTHLIVEEVEFGAEGYFYIDPALAIDKEHNIAITYSRSSDLEYCGAFYSTRHSIDPPGLSPSRVLAEGKGYYEVIGGWGRNRWGDYMGIYLDPENEYDIWMNIEYAADENLWGTRIARIRMEPFSGIYTFVIPLTVDFGDVEVNTASEEKTIIVSNYGEDALVISDIVDNVGPFVRTSTHNFPITLNTYDTMYVTAQFSPATSGYYDEILTVSSNDPTFTGFQLTGNAYDMMPAFTDLFYASTGPGNNGDILTVNRGSGAGTTLGSSLFPEISSVSVNPVTNIMFGLVAGVNSSGIVRINAGQGDAYLLYEVDLPSLSAIAFNSSGTLYIGQQTGEIYMLDVLNGNMSLVDTAEIYLNALAFHPVTDQLWAAKRKIIGMGKDEIYTIDLANGSAMLIGSTGFGILTNDLAFDENNNLYGVIGSGSETGKLIEINTADGSGMLIGDIGFNNVVGLGYSINGPVNLIDEYRGVLPDKYSLYQNFPNPFNPSTKIRYSIPHSSNVTIKVFDVLGNEIATLVNEEKLIGSFEITWYAEGLPSGVYFYQLRAGDPSTSSGHSFVETKKMVLLK